MSSKKFNSFKDFQSHQIQRSYRKIFPAHYACRNADLNLALFMGSANGFVFQIVNSLTESWGVMSSMRIWSSQGKFRFRKHLPIGGSTFDVDCHDVKFLISACSR